MNLARRGPISVVKTQLVEDDLEVFDMGRGRKIGSATAAVGTKAGVARLPVKRNTQREGPLDDVKELAEGKVEQQGHNTRRMGQPDECEAVTC
jgi:hypothetical protein